MPEFKWTDFLGGMVTDINDANIPSNAFKDIISLDVWSKRGSAILYNDLALHQAFPSTKEYKKLVTFPVQGVKDYIIILMTDGTIYSYDGTTFVYIGAITASAGIENTMVYAGDFVYVFGRHLTSPSTANTNRKIIYYDNASSSFKMVDAFVKDRTEFVSKTQITNAVVNTSIYYKVFVVSFNKDGGGSFGWEYTGELINGQDEYILMKQLADFDSAKVFMSFKNNATDTFPTPQLVFEVNNGKSFVPFLSGEMENTSGADSTNLIVRYEDTFGSSTAASLSKLLDLSYAGTKTYLTTGRKVRINGRESTISSIIKDVPPPEGIFTVVLTDAIVPPFSQTHDDSSDFVNIEIELDWDTEFFIPVQKRYSTILGQLVTQYRPETKLTSGTGNVITFIKNRLITGNPYFPDVQGNGKETDKKGFFSWGYITGTGEFANSVIPDDQLIAPTLSGSEIVDMFSFQDTAFILQKNSISRFNFNNGLTFLQTDNLGVNAKEHYFVDSGNMFLASNRKLYAGAVENIGYQSGKFQFEELSRNIASILDATTSPDPRLAFDSINNIIYYDDNAVVPLICSLRNGKPIWVKNGTSLSIQASFKLNQTIYFITSLLGNDSIYKYGTTKLNAPLIQSHDIYVEFGNDYLRKVEVLYQCSSSTSLNLQLVLDDVALPDIALPNQTTKKIYEVKLDRTKNTRFKKLSWKISGVGVSDDFELSAVYINRDAYTRETNGGY